MNILVIVYMQSGTLSGDKSCESFLSPLSLKCHACPLATNISGTNNYAHHPRVDMGRRGNRPTKRGSAEHQSYRLFPPHTA